VAGRVTSPEFVGRTEQLAILEAALHRAERGEAAAAFVAGDSGVGKTRLLRELERRATARGVAVLRGDCVAFGAGELPYAPIGDALRGLLRAVGEERFDELAGAGRGALARLVPELGVAAGGEQEPATALAATGEPLAQAMLFGALRGLLDRLASEAAVVLVIEDLHWADRSTLEFLSSLLRGLRDERLLVVCSYRSDELHRRHPLRPFLAEEERRPIVERIDVGSFTLPELTEQVASILGAAPDQALVDRLHERTEGNAFFVEELLAASADATGPVPSSLQEVLTLRLELLDEDARAVLRVAAAAGRRTTHALLATVADLPEPRLLDALRAAIARQVFVQDDDGYAFRHALLQEAAYGDLLPGERRTLHIRIAEALAADASLAGGTAAAELAHHWRAAHRLPEALAAYVRAGIEAERVYAFAEANRYFESALDLWDGIDDAESHAGHRLADVVAHAAEDAHATGDHRRSVTLGREAVQLMDGLGDPVRCALARERLGRYLWRAGDSDRALAVYGEAVDLLPPEPPTADLARVLGAQAQILMLRGDMARSRALSERAIAAARQVAAPTVEGHALNTFGTVLAALGDHEGGERALREAMRIAREFDAIDDVCRAYINLGEVIDQKGDLDEAVAFTREGVRFAERVGLRSAALFLESDLSWRLIRLGRLDEADAIVQRAFVAGALGAEGLGAEGSAAQIALRRGDLREAAPHADRARGFAGGTGDAMWIGYAATSGVELELWRGDPDAAWRHAAEALNAISGGDYGFYTLHLYCAALRAAADIAERARALGDAAKTAEAQRAATQTLAAMRVLLSPEHLTAGPPTPEALAHDAVGAAELTRASGASDPDAWAAAAERFAALSFPFEQAYSRWREGEALVVRDRARAGDALRKAAALADEVGARLLSGEVAGLARRARIALDSSAPVQPANADTAADELGLTDRERAVLELVAEGRTNREIGDALFMAEKTASVHVSRILAKLGVRSRVEAATAAHRLGLTMPSDD
jgi:DNA-binding CsgD family transcriptional regulator/tetratricopeptide (TPR) repeat protein